VIESDLDAVIQIWTVFFFRSASSGIPAAEAVLNVAAFLTILYVFIILYLLNEKIFSRYAGPESQRLLIETPTSTIRREIRIEKPYYPIKT
jgi:hypothetical protein